MTLTQNDLKAIKKIVDTRVITEKEIDYLEKRFKDIFITKDDFTDYKSGLFDKLDEIVKNTADTKQETELIENRVTKLEEKAGIPASSPLTF